MVRELIHSCAHISSSLLYLVTIKTVLYRADRTALYPGYSKRETAVFSIYLCIHTHIHLYRYEPMYMCLLSCMAVAIENKQ